MVVGGLGLGRRSAITLRQPRMCLALKKTTSICPVTKAAGIGPLLEGAESC